MFTTAAVPASRNALRRAAMLMAVFAVAACARHTTSSEMRAGDDIARGFPPAVQRNVATLRAATAGYHDIRVAQAAGYPTTTPACVADSTMGGMGRHYLDRATWDDKLDIAHPEMLIYAPSPNGQPDHLVGVEYAIPFSALPSTATPPRLFGQEFRRQEQSKYWYLHVWAWQKNDAGLFADWNPAIRC